MCLHCRSCHFTLIFNHSKSSILVLSEDSVQGTPHVVYKDNGVTMTSLVYITSETDPTVDLGDHVKIPIPSPKVKVT